MNTTRCPEEFGCYRYRLRVEGIELSGKEDRGGLVFIMFNPATTSEERDLETGGHTRGRRIKLAKDEGYGSLTEVNLFAYRAPDKRALQRAVTEKKVDPVGPENNRLMYDTVMGAAMVVAARGSTNCNRLFRRNWFTGALRSTDKADLVCVDPDNSVKPKGPKAYNDVGLKFAYMDDLRTIRNTRRGLSTPRKRSLRSRNRLSYHRQQSFIG